MLTGKASRRIHRVACISAVVTVAVAGVSALVWRPWIEPGGDASYDTSVPAAVLSARHPRVIYDHGHRNAHSIKGRFAPFAGLLRADGCDVQQRSESFDAGSLAAVDILVIVNPEGPEGHRADSAFSPAEISQVKSWVEGGGALLLAADHHPYGPAAAELARAFGVAMLGGWLEDLENAFPGTADSGAIAFRRERAMLGEHAILSGRDAQERIGMVVTFTGQSLIGPEGAAILLRCADSAVDRVPSGSKSQTVNGVTTTTFETMDTPAAGHAQGLALTVGKGRVVVLGEAAMLSAQVDAKNGQKFGMNIPGIDNRQFVLNTARWLAGELP